MLGRFLHSLEGGEKLCALQTQNHLSGLNNMSGMERDQRMKERALLKV